MSSDDQRVIRVITTDGETVTCDPKLVVAISTSKDQETSTIFLQGNVQIVVNGGGEKLRKRVHGESYKPAKGSVQEKQEVKRRKAASRKEASSHEAPLQLPPK